MHTGRCVCIDVVFGSTFINPRNLLILHSFIFQTVSCEFLDPTIKSKVLVTVIFVNLILFFFILVQRFFAAKNQYLCLFVTASFIVVWLHVWESGFLAIKAWKLFLTLNCAITLVLKLFFPKFHSWLSKLVFLTLYVL